MRIGNPDSAAPEAAGAEATSPRDMLRRFLQGDLASLRVILAIAVIWIIFQLENDRFLSATNLTNLFLQITAVGLISVGVVLVLLLGEIDLSVGAVSGLCAAIMAVLNVQHGWGVVPSVAMGVLAGLAIGFAQGFLFTQFRIPSFVVTLAGLLTWQGALLLVLGKTGTVNLNNSGITDFANTFYSDTVGWIFAAVVIALFAFTTLAGHQKRRAAGVTTEPFPLLMIRIIAVAVVTVVAIAILNSDRGLPLALIILLAFVVGFQLITTRTVFGRHLYATGGNAEAAQLAGIRTDRVKIAAFAITGCLAALAGVLLMARLRSGDPQIGIEWELSVIAAVVVGGVSLRGGIGSVAGALLGVLFLQVVSTGLVIAGVESALQPVAVGVVMIAALAVDQLRRTRSA